MAQSGLQIPADTDSTVGIFRSIFADIGDEQSIEMSLSTFSAHMGHIIKALEKSESNSLVLLDEIGAGTDPAEGAALGQAILQDLTERGVKTIVTTHLGALKVLAQNDPRVRNSSFEFDSKSLKPTYQFRIGLPGSSYAVEIAARLGLKADIVSRASELVGTQERDLTSLLNQLDSQLKEIRQEKEAASKQAQEAGKLISLYTEKLQKLEKEEREIKSKTLGQAKELISKSRLHIEHLIKELRETKADKQSIKEALAYIQQQGKEIEEAEAKNRPQKLVKLEDILPGDAVWVESLNTEGEVLSKPDKSGRVKVQIRGLNFSLSSQDLFKAQPSRKTRKGQTKFTPQSETVAPEMSVRGLTAQEALEKVDKYIDQALLAGLTEVAIIHGKGTGTLRKRVTEFLKGHSRVEETRLAEWDQGGIGVTIVKLKK